MVLSPAERTLASLRQLTNLFPLWVVLAALVGYHHPPLFGWFCTADINWSLVLCMLAKGLTLTFGEITSVEEV
jgi:predicted Na+-dependent transporter